MCDKKSVWLQATKCGLLAVAFSCIAILFLSLFAKIFCFDEKILPVLNVIAKVLSLTIAIFLCIREDTFLPKCIIAGGVFWLASFLLYVILGGKFVALQLLLDLIIYLAIALLLAIIKSRRTV